MVYANGQATQTLLNNFLRLPEEQLLFAKKKHWFTLFVSLLVLFALSTLFSIGSFFLLTFFMSNSVLLATIVLTITLFTITIAIKLLIDWYCHLYIVTTRKILEVCYSPLFSHHVSDVLLDQVRVTEVDVQKDGILNELIDLGNVSITFDRPTHQQECMLSDIAEPEKIGVFLGGALVDGVRRTIPETVWYKIEDKDGKQNLFRFTEEIFPGTQGITQRVLGAR